MRWADVCGQQSLFKLLWDTRVELVALDARRIVIVSRRNLSEKSE